jgi:hypothetical protein
MVQRTLLEEEKIERTVRAVTHDSFTVLDFMAAFKRRYPVTGRILLRDLGSLGVREGTQPQLICRIGLTFTYRNLVLFLSRLLDTSRRSSKTTEEPLLKKEKSLEVFG